jgi:predicted acetyltransferase
MRMQLVWPSSTHLPSHIDAFECVALTPGTTNLASRRVIETNGGDLVEWFQIPPQYGSLEDFRFRIFV